MSEKISNLKMGTAVEEIKFSMGEIARTFNIYPETVGGISYRASRLRIPLNNGSFVEFREGDDELNDHEVKIYSNDMLKYG